MQDAAGAPVTFTVLRAGKEIEVTAQSKMGEKPKVGGKKGEKEKAWMLGVKFVAHPERVDVGIGAVGHALYYPIDQSAKIGKGLYDIITGRQKGEVTGVVGIGAVAKKAIESGLLDIAQLLMILNVYLGLFNLLPLPALDGGRRAFLGYETATRRRATPKIEATVHMVGIMALLLVMVLVTYRDITRLF